LLTTHYFAKHLYILRFLIKKFQANEANKPLVLDIRA